MKKRVLVSLATMAAATLLAGSAFAGTIKTAAGAAFPAFTAAKEAVDGGTTAAPQNPDMGAYITGAVYSPTDIPLTTLNAGVVNLGISSGVWTAVVPAGFQLQLCDDSNVAQAVYHTGTGTNTLTFDQFTAALGTTIAPPGTFTNGKKYTLKIGAPAPVGDCAAPVPAGIINLTIPPQTAAQTATIKLGIATSQTVFDTASTQLTDVKYQLSGSVSTKASYLIDYASTPPFAKLYNTATGLDVTADAIKVDTNFPAFNLNATTAVGDQIVYTITVSDVAGIATTGSATIAMLGTTKFGAAVPPGIACSNINTTTKQIVCTVTNTLGALTAGTTSEQATITINVDGTTVISEKTFTVTQEYKFLAASKMVDRSVANTNAILTAADGGKWQLRGTTVYVPLLKEDASKGLRTFIKLQSKDKTAGANQVRALVLCSDGVVRTITLGTITAGTPFATDSKAIMDAVTALGASVDGVAGFAVTLNITTDATNLYGYANIVDALGNAKRIAISTISGVFN